MTAREARVRARLVVATMGSCLLMFAALPVACSAQTDSKWQDLPADQALARLEQKNQPLFLDVRSPEEFASGHIPGALNIPHRQVAARIDEIRASGKREIVVFCERGGRASAAADVLRKADVGKLYHLEGDMSGWRARGYPLVRGARSGHAPAAAHAEEPADGGADRE